MQGNEPLEPVLAHVPLESSLPCTSRVTRDQLPIPQLDERTEQVRWKYLHNDQLWMLVPDENNDIQ